MRVKWTFDFFFDLDSFDHYELAIIPAIGTNVAGDFFSDQEQKYIEDFFTEHDINVDWDLFMVKYIILSKDENGFFYNINLTVELNNE